MTTIGCMVMHNLLTAEGDETLGTAVTTSPASAASMPPVTRHPVAVAYLVSQYPKVSHAFIEREIRALRAAGATVHTFSVNPVPDSEVLTDDDRAERSRTPALLADHGEILGALIALAISHPRTFVRALGLALRSGPRTPKGKLWQLFYLAEAALLVLQMTDLGLRHLHVHFANNSADVARLVTAIGNSIDRGTGYRPWSWSLAMHGPTEFADVAGHDLPAKLRSARFVACISQFCRAQLMSLVGPEHASKLHVVRMTVERDRYPSMIAARATRSGPTRFVFVGRLVPEKGPLLMLDALASLPAGSWQLRIVGDGPLRDQLARRIAELGLREQVSLLGALGQDELPAQYAWADAFCLPSLAEGLPVVLMEAMSTGLPVVSTRIAGIPELVEDGTTGLLVAPGRQAELASALELLLDPALRSRLAARAAEAVHENHDGPANAAKLLRLLNPIPAPRTGS